MLEIEFKSVMPHIDPDTIIAKNELSATCLSGRIMCCVADDAFVVLRKRDAEMMARISKGPVLVRSLIWDFGLKGKEVREMYVLLDALVDAGILKIRHEAGKKVRKSQGSRR